MTTTADRPRYTLTVEALPDPLVRAHGEKFGRTPEYRLKVLLKLMLRRFGLRAVTLRPAGGSRVPLSAGGKP